MVHHRRRILGMRHINELECIICIAQHDPSDVDGCIGGDKGVDDHEQEEKHVENRGDLGRLLDVLQCGRGEQVVVLERNTQFARLHFDAA